MLYENGREVLSQVNVWIRRVRKKATCTHEGCSKPTIANGEYCVVTQWYMKTRGGKNWQKQRSFHPQCWIDRAVAEIERRVVTETRGRQRMAITDVHREARLKILRKRAAIVQRIRQALAVTNYALVCKLGDKLDMCKEEIGQHGGAPAKW